MLTPEESIRPEIGTATVVQEIRRLGFSKSDEDHCLFTKIARDGSPIFLIIYMDNMLLSGRHVEELAELVRQLRLMFAMKDLGPARHILGMKISQHRNR